MCIICLEWEKGKLTSKEAFRNLGEVINTTEDEDTRRHLFELSEKIIDKELPSNQADQELDKTWYDETYED